MTSTPPHLTPRREALAGDLPTFREIAAGPMVFVDGIAVGFSLLPGSVVCVPGVLLAIVPIAVLGLLAVAGALVLAIVAAPLLAVRAVAHRIRDTSAPKRAVAMQAPVMRA